MVNFIKRGFIAVFCVFLLATCASETQPKPMSYLSLSYPESTYKKVDSPCDYTFEISEQANVQFDENRCWVKINYPQLKATIHITYREVDGNLMEILREVEKLTYEHTIKADKIHPGKDYENATTKVYGRLYQVEGNVASNVQFRMTDSVQHVLSGALYFKVRPNYDSILPAVKYIEKDILHLMETTHWK
ncbi:MAG: gliding motility lipoprotein GldD [Flavobacteriaceae bacterium]|nr:MAG: gliding motility lipoprotein GldD [Flavobacteriaceae bacterium]